MVKKLLILGMVGVLSFTSITPTYAETTDYNEEDYEEDYDEDEEDYDEDEDDYDDSEEKTTVAKEKGTKQKLSVLISGLPKNNKILNRKCTVYVKKSPKIKYYFNGKLYKTITYQNKTTTFGRNGKYKLIIYDKWGYKYTRKFTIDCLSPKIYRTGKYIRVKDLESGIKYFTINGKKIKGKKKYKMRKYRVVNNSFKVVAYDKAGNSRHASFMYR